MLVISVTQTAGLILMGVLVLAFGPAPPEAKRLLYGAAAGLVGVGGLAAFYRGMAIGTMGVITPITATAVMVPVTVGLIQGERPSALQGAGIGLALVGVVVASLEPERKVLHDRRISAGVGFALIAALCFGSSLTGVHAAAVGGPLWATLAMRAAAVPVAIAIAFTTRARVRGSLRLWPLLIAVGVVDTGATLLFGAAGNRGLLSVVAVLASLYPVIVAILARIFLDERLAPSQLAGAAGALLGIALISAG
jgi:drug/metabolite transporter (DMT)-like permease